MTFRNIAPTSRYRNSIERIRSYTPPAPTAPPPFQLPPAFQGPPQYDPVEQFRSAGQPRVPESVFDYMEGRQDFAQPQVPDLGGFEWDDTLADAQQATFDNYLNDFISGADPDSEFQNTLDNIGRERRQLQEEHDLTIEGINLARNQAYDNLQQQMAQLDLSEDEIAVALRQFEEETALQIEQVQENYDLSVRQLALQVEAATAARDVAVRTRERGQVSQEEMQNIYEAVRARGQMMWERAENWAANETNFAVLEQMAANDVNRTERTYGDAERATIEGASTDLDAAAKAAIREIVSAQQGDDVEVAQALTDADLAELANAVTMLQTQAAAGGAASAFNLDAMSALDAANFQIQDEQLAQTIEGLDREQQALALQQEGLDLGLEQTLEGLNLGLNQAREDAGLALRGVGLDRQGAQLAYRQRLDDLLLAQEGEDMALRHGLEDFFDAEFQTISEMQDAINGYIADGGSQDEIARDLALGVATDIMGDIMAENGVPPSRRIVLMDTLMDMVATGLISGEGDMATMIDQWYTQDPNQTDQYGDPLWVLNDGIDEPFIETLTKSDYDALVQGARAYGSSWENAYDTVEAAMSYQAGLQTQGSPYRASGNWENRNEPEYRERAQFVTDYRSYLQSVFPNITQFGQWRDEADRYGPGRDPDSDHLAGGALDIYAATHEEMQEIADWLRANGGDAVAYVVYDGDPNHEGHHVHVSFNLGVTAAPHDHDHDHGGGGDRTAAT